MEKMKNTSKKITQTIETGTVSATFGIVVITLMLVFAGWSVYEKYKDEGLIAPASRGGVNASLKVIYEDTSGEQRETTAVIEQ